MECLNQFREIIFNYEKKIFSDHNNVVYVATLRESQRVMRWQLIPEEFGTNIKHKYGVKKIVYDTIII